MYGQLQPLYPVAAIYLSGGAMRSLALLCRSSHPSAALAELDSVSLDMSHYLSIVDVTWGLKRGEDRIDYIIVHANSIPPRQLT